MLQFVCLQQGFCIKRLCSSKKTFEKYLESLWKWFGKRGYPKKLIDNQLKRVKAI